jgi:hypothetical protein
MDTESIRKQTISEMFAQQSHSLAIDLPADLDQSIRLLNMNIHIRHQVLLHHPSTTRPTMLAALKSPALREHKIRLRTAFAQPGCP